MTVRLISYTPNAIDLLIYTKSTRLTLGQETEEKIKKMSEEEKMAELDYMSTTIPSSWEFIDYIFEITEVSRAFTHQLVRTRNASYAQQTQRMVNMGDFQYVIPENIVNGNETLAVYKNCMNNISAAYNQLVELGMAPEDARGVLPTNICTNIIAKFNLRTFSELAKSRTGGRTQDEYRKIMNLMVDEVLKVHPWADKFLFPKGRDVFKELEEIVNEHKAIDKEKAIKALKAIDILRKEAK